MWRFGKEAWQHRSGPFEVFKEEALGSLSKGVTMV